jgi:hypothetical protein
VVAINDVVDGIATNLATISGLRVYSEWPDSPNPPCAIVMPSEEFVSPKTLDGGYDMAYDVIVLVPTASGMERNLRTLNTYCDTSGSTSVRAAVESDATLGAVVSDLFFVSTTGYGLQYEFGTVRYVGVRFQFAILI